MMKKLLFFCLAVLASTTFHAQVGIGTTAPEAQLDIRSSNQAAPENNDGLLIPKIDEFPLVNPTINKDGMMVFATGLGSVAKGFYYWENNTLSWVGLAAGSGSDEDWYEVGTTTAPDDINDDKFTFGNIAIGKNTADWKLDILDNDGGTGTYINMIGTDNAATYGVETEITSTGDGTHRGLNTILSGSGSGTHTGSYVTMNGDGSGETRGFVASISGNGTGVQRGTFVDISTTQDALHYGAVNRLRSTGNGTHYGVFNLMEGIGSGDHIGEFSNFTAGTGNLTGNWTQFSGTLGNGNQLSAYNVYSSGGDGILAGAYTDIRSSVLGNGFQYGYFSRNESPGSGFHYGIRNEMVGAGTGEQTGMSTLLSNTGNGNHYGINTRFSGIGSGAHTGMMSRFTEGTGNLTGSWTEFSGNVGNGNQIAAYNSYFAGGNGVLAGAYTEIRNTVAGTGPQYGTYTSNSSTGAGQHYGNFNFLAGTGAGDKFGTYNLIPPSAGGTHYGIFSQVEKTGSFAGYFVGNFRVLNGYSEFTNTADASGVAGTGSMQIGGTLRLDGDEIITSTNSTLYLQRDNNGDLMVDGTTLMVDASTDRVGILHLSPDFDLHIKQSTNTATGAGGLGFENSNSTDTWKIYHSSAFLSFAENGVRRAYITNGTGAYVATSDKRLKKQIVPAGNVLPKLKNLTSYNYLYKTQPDSAKQTIGFMAQDVQPLFPELVETDEEGYLGLNYSGFGVIAIKAIQEQQLEIETLKKQLSDQQAEIAEIKKLLQARE